MMSNGVGGGAKWFAGIVAAATVSVIVANTPLGGWVKGLFEKADEHATPAQPPKLADAGRCSVTGHLYDLLNDPAVGVQVFAVDESERVVMRASTGPEGDFAWNGTCATAEGAPILVTRGRCFIDTGAIISSQSNATVNFRVDPESLKAAGPGPCP
jgi:hypothetical protein